MKIIKIKLHFHIKRLGITQDEFARMSGLRPATVSLLVNNKYDRVKLSHFVAILDALGSEDFNSILEIVDG